MSYAIALSGGGARGIAHLGVLQALEEENVKISAVSGVSSGALIGAFYASGYPPKEILEIISKTNFFRLLHPALSLSGLLYVDALANHISKYLPDNFESLQIPLTVNATNLDKGITTYFSTGKLIRPILASCCVPAVFMPSKIGGVRYVDGGILNNLPIEPFLDTSHKIIGVHANPTDKKFTKRPAKSIIERCLLMAISSNVTPRISKCDHYIEPPFLSRYSSLDVLRSSRLFKIGYIYTKKNLDALGFGDELITR